MRDEPNRRQSGLRLHPSSVPSLLKCRHLDDFPVSVAHGVAAGEDFEPFDLFGIAVKIFTLDFLLRVLRCGCQDGL